MSPSPEQAKKVAVEFVDLLNRRDFDSMLSLFAPGGRWVVPMNPTKASWGGTLPANEMIQVVKAFLGEFETWSYRAEDVIVAVEGTRVVVEGVSKGRGPGPVEYDNTYLKRFVIDENGKIEELKEMLDPYEVEIMNESKQIP